MPEEYEAIVDICGTWYNPGVEVIHYFKENVLEITGVECSHPKIKDGIVPYNKELADKLYGLYH